MKIDLGKKKHDMGLIGMKLEDHSDKDETHYPSVYLGCMDGKSDMSVGDMVKCVGKIISKTEHERDGKKTHDLEIELQSMEPHGESSKPMNKSDNFRKKGTEDIDEIDKAISDSENSPGKKKVSDEEISNDEE